MVHFNGLCISSSLYDYYCKLTLNSIAVVADVLLVLLFYWFFHSGRIFTSSATNLLLLVSITLFGYGFLPSNIFGLKVPSIPLSSFDMIPPDHNKYNY
ncbi:hypothetical protein Patl1_26471 [Pistacia atlantica]|uniref:Uncharacterized protein n=1 Tax=Pistacia atlantica TaxID=434234 RepID=A0ACC1B4T5_9ROSI|nr:hypothetical protein Patl1_26471 [Pistacia atlantica]